MADPRQTKARHPPECQITVVEHYLDNGHPVQAGSGSVRLAALRSALGASSFARSMTGRSEEDALRLMQSVERVAPRN